METEETILKINERTTSGVLYTDEAADDLVEQINSKEGPFGKMGFIEDFNKGISGKKAGLVTREARRENGRVVAKIEILDTDEGKKIRENLENVIFRTATVCEIEEDEEDPDLTRVTSIKDVTQVSAVNKEEDTFG